MNWYNIELSLKNAELFQEKLYGMCIKFEKSAAHNLYHFEVLLEKDSKEYMELNAFCNNLPYFNA